MGSCLPHKRDGSNRSFRANAWGSMLTCSPMGLQNVLGDAGRWWVRWKLGRKAEPESVVEMYERRYSRLAHDTYAGDVMAGLLLDVRDLDSELNWRGGGNSPDRGNRYGAR